MTSDNISAENAPQQSPGLPLVIHTQYVKDISFENPMAPHSFRTGLPAPKMDLNINLDARQVEDLDIKDLYEVTLKIAARALRDDKPVFIAEIQYAVAVSIQDVVPENQHHALLMIEVPRLAFPFVRQILSDLTQAGGYPALLLGPVDFYAMYMNRFGKQEKEATN